MPSPGPRGAATGLLAVIGVPLLLLVTTSGPGSRPGPPLDRDAVLAAFASPERSRVDGALAAIRRAWPPPVDWLVSLLTHDERGVREWSAHALGDLAPADAHVVQALMRAFRDDDDYVRWKAARALGRIGPPARAALPLLEPVAHAAQEVEVVRATALLAVARIRGEPDRP